MIVNDRFLRNITKKCVNFDPQYTPEKHLCCYYHIMEMINN